jgi:DNA polymerase-3 subunit alpha
VDSFAGYGFNKSHAAAYALIAYQTAWLKANYPVAFYAGLHVVGF